MRVVLVINLLVVTCVLLSESATISDSALMNQELFVYKEQIRLLYRLLAEECPDEVRVGRADDDDVALTDLEVQKLHYNGLLKRLNNCRKINRMRTLPVTSTKTQQKTTKPTTTEPTTTKPTTTEPTTTKPLPAPCLSATNLTDSWRMDHEGKDLKGGGPNAYIGRACDLRKELQWFRFTGPAGKNSIL